MQWILYKPLPKLKFQDDNYSQNNKMDDGISINFESKYNDTMAGPKGSSYFEYNASNNRYIEMSPLMPFGMMLLICTVVFILIIFRRSGLAAGIIAGCLTSISVYLLLLALKEQKQDEIYE